MIIDNYFEADLGFSGFDQMKEWDQFEFSTSQSTEAGMTTTDMG
jgi:hypothetical protein